MALTGVRAWFRVWAEMIWDLGHNALRERALQLMRALRSEERSSRNSPPTKFRVPSGGSPFQGAGPDLQFALRRLWKNPAYTILAILTLGLGIGLNTAVFQAVSSIWLNELTYPNSDQLVRLQVGPRGTTNGKVSAFLMDELRQAEAFQGVAVFDFGSFAVSGEAHAEIARGASASVNLFQVLGVEAALGRTFGADEGVAGSSDVLVISHGYWNRRYGADPSVVGRTLAVNGSPHTIIGVLSSDFEDPAAGAATEVWRPLTLSPQPTWFSSSWLVGVARFADGVAPVQADAEVETLWNRLNESSPGLYGPEIDMRLQSLRDSIYGDGRLPMLYGLGAAVFVLLIACLNLVSLVLARVAHRRRELAVLAALGAGRWRVFRGLIIENGLLAGAGGVVGLLLASAIGRIVAFVADGRIPRLEATAPDVRVALFALSLSVFAGLVFGIWPVLRSGGAAPGAVLKEAAAGGGGRRGSRLRRGLVVSQFALSVVLLVGGGVALRSFLGLLNADRGFSDSDVITFELRLPSGQYGSAEEVVAFQDDLIERLMARPEVEVAGAVDDPPLGSRWGCGDIVTPESPVVVDSRAICVDERIATPGYFAAMEVPLIRGRLLEETDEADGPPVVLVNETLAARAWPGEDPIGRLVRFSGSEEPWRIVVGIVGDVRHFGPRSPSALEMYAPHRQRPDSRMTFMVRGAAAGSGLLRVAREVVPALDSELPMRNLARIEDVVRASIAGDEYVAWAMLTLAAVALVLSLGGVYGVLAFLVAQRTREVGIRIALGASRGAVTRMVVRQGVTMGLVGLVLGVPLAVLGTMSVSGALFGVRPADPITLGAVASLLLVVSAAASYSPARRASAVNPTVALREE